MRNFFVKTTLASALGFILAILTLFGLIFMIAIFSGGSKAPKAKKGSVLKLDLSIPIPERTNNIKEQGAMSFNLSNDKILGLEDIIRTLAKAKTDEKISGLLLSGLYTTNGSATNTRLRKAISDFKDSGKFVVAYAKYYSQNAYYMASAADEVYLNPLGNVELRGFARMTPFFKEALDKLGVKAQVFYAGKFKSATEPFRYTQMSEPSKLQVRRYMSGLYDVFISDIAKSREMTEVNLRQVADTLSLKQADQALAMGLVDSLFYKDQLQANIRTRLSIEEDEDISVMMVADYFNSIKWKSTGKDKIAVVYAEGSIVDGKGGVGKIGDKQYVKILQDIRKDDNIKALVLRINSGGGSAMASENIWREIELLKEKGIPVVATMGDVAASGGYYIACNADKIFAEKNTITGSIGVFAMIPNTKEFMNDKLGIYYDTVSTNPNAVPINGYYAIEGQNAIMFQNLIDNMYQTFLERVAKGRNLSVDSVHSMAQGRVWTGVDALSIGLIDSYGGLDAAIAEAKQLAGIETNRLAEFPVVKTKIEQLLEDFTGKKVATSFSEEILKEELGSEMSEIYLQLKEIKEMEGIQMRLPWSIEL